MSLSGLSGLSGVLPSPNTFNWALMPNVPAPRRSPIEASCLSAASGQSFSAENVFTTLSQASYYFSFEVGSVFSTTNPSTPVSNVGDAVGCARDWVTQTLVTQTNPSNRPTLSGKGLLMPAGRTLEAGVAFTNNTSFTVFVVGRPTGATGGTFFRVGSGSAPNAGWGIGVGSGTMDNPGTSQVAAHDQIAWVPTSQAMSTTVAGVSVFRRGAGVTTLFFNGLQTTTNSSNIQPPDSKTYVNGIPGVRSPSSEISAIMVFQDSLSNAEIDRINRFLSSYYGLGI